MGSSGSGSSAWLLLLLLLLGILNAQQRGWENKEGEIEKRGRGKWSIGDQKAIKAARIITWGWGGCSGVEQQQKWPILGPWHPPPPH